MSDKLVEHLKHTLSPPLADLSQILAVWFNIVCKIFQNGFLPRQITLHSTAFWVGSVHFVFRETIQFGSIHSLHLSFSVRQFRKQVVAYLCEQAGLIHVSLQIIAIFSRTSF